jgi:rare lipoprotein A
MKLLPLSAAISALFVSQLIVNAWVEPWTGSVETGLASWYGYPFHGRAAADGEIYSMENLTAAHRTLPFNTWVRVVNLTNDKAVEVRIIDRGPFIDGRIIDLSHAAARALEIIGPGTAPVRLEVLRSPPAVTGSFAVQVGAFRDGRNAQRYCRLMQSRYGAARVLLRGGDPVLWRVVAGWEPTENAANSLAERIRRETGEKSAFVVRVDGEP